MSSLEIRQERDVAIEVEVVAPRGEIDVSNVEILDQALEEALDRGPRCLIVDLDGVEYLDSAGVSSLLRANQVIVRSTGDLVLVGGSRFVRRLLQMTRVNRLLPHYETVSAALQARGGGTTDASPAGGAPSPAGNTAPAVR